MNFGYRDKEDFKDPNSIVLGTTGAFCSTDLMLVDEANKIFRIKKVTTKEINTKAGNTFMRSVKMQAMLCHPLFPRLYEINPGKRDSSEYFEYAYKIEEYIPGGTLSDHVHSRGLQKNIRNDKSISLTEQFDNFIIIYGITYALYLFHGKNIIHRDIKPDNIIITPNHKVVVIDFGFSRELVDSKCNAKFQDLTNSGSGNYAAPEISHREVNEPYDEKIDIYSLGATILYLVTEVYPSSNISEQIGKLPSVEELKPFLDIIELCISNKSQSRPSAQRLLKVVYDEAMKTLPSQYFSKFMKYVSELDTFHVTEYSVDMNCATTQILNPPATFPERGTLMNIFESAHNKRSTIDLYILHSMYYNGIGVETDIAKAAFYTSILSSFGVQDPRQNCAKYVQSSQTNINSAIKKYPYSSATLYESTVDSQGY